MKLPWTVVVKRSDDFTTAIFTWRHIVSAASPNEDNAGENLTWRDPAYLGDVKTSNTLPVNSSSEIRVAVLSY